MLKSFRAKDPQRQQTNQMICTVWKNTKHQVPNTKYQMIRIVWEIGEWANQRKNVNSLFSWFGELDNWIHPLFFQTKQNRDAKSHLNCNANLAQKD